MTCSNCGATSAPGQKFCGECGLPLALVCAECGTANAPSQRFCGECGANLGGAAARIPGAPGASAAPPSLPIQGHRGGTAAAPVAERRLVSVLFADLVGFTPFAEEKDAEDVREVLTRYFETASDVVGRYGGTIEKFIGDAVMAVWGAPTAREDDAERAVRAGLELVDAVKVLGVGIQARCGVLTGEAAVTLGAINQGMVAGDLVNTAARLQSVAAPGTVLVGEATFRAASQAIMFEAAGTPALKGKESPVPAWRAVRVVAERGGRGRSDALEAPFVGRDAELRLLKDLFHATGRDRRIRHVSMIGPGGLGKSRLAWEFEKYLDGISERVWWHQGRSPAYGEGVTFWALGEMIRVRAGLSETDDEAATRAGISAMLDQHLADDPDRRWIESALLELLGVSTGIASDELFGAWRTFFERIAETGTVLLVFQDLHWADPGTIDFIDHLAEWSRGSPIFVLSLSRPDLLDRRPDWGAGQRSFTSLYLEPLAEEAMRELLAGVVPGLPTPAADAIVARAEGVPLYAIETIRMLVATGQLVANDDGTYLPNGDLTELAVPESLTALIAARLDSLDPADRAMLLDAAVLGQSFTPAGLGAISGSQPDDLEARLRSLVRRELLTQVADPRSPERGQFQFVQALIREVAYNTLAKKDRKSRHLAAARWFESLGEPELAGALAGHYLAARANATPGPEADALAAQARIALKAAADRAASLGAHRQALSFYEQALSITVEEGEEADLRRRAGESAAIAGDFDQADGHFSRALELMRARGDRPATAALAGQLGQTLLTGRRSDRAIALLEASAAEFRDLGDDPARLLIVSQLARGYYLMGDPARAVELAEQVLEVAERTDQLVVLADTLVTKGSSLAGLFRRREGLG
ncbi:MAG: adenylate/guanylate cyclase domain-containing protein, partial [Chloroflexota bacterium]